MKIHNRLLLLDGRKVPEGCLESKDKMRKFCGECSCSFMKKQDKKKIDSSYLDPTTNQEEKEKKNEIEIEIQEDEEEEEEKNIEIFSPSPPPKITNKIRPPRRRHIPKRPR